MRFLYSRPASVSNCVKIVVDGVDSRVPKSPSAGAYSLSTGILLSWSSFEDDSGREARFDSERSSDKADGSGRGERVDGLEEEIGRANV